VIYLTTTFSYGVMMAN